MKMLISVTAATAMLGACSFIPEYQRPEAPVPAAWPAGPARQAAENADGDLVASDIGWRDFFVDPQLQTLIEQAFENNPDAQIAALQVEQVRARYQLQNAQIRPQINAQASYTRQQNPTSFSSNNSVGDGGTGNGSDTGGGSRTSAGSFDFYRVGVGLTAYELDLFGRIRSLETQALEQYLASIQARRAAEITLVAEVASAYSGYLADRALLDLARKTLDAQQKSLDLIQKRFDAGISSALDVHQAQTTVEAARADLAQFRRRAASDRNALVELTGVPISPGSMSAQSLTSPKVGADLSPGLRSDLLLRRPDVLQAEHNLVAANANIGAARAAFFPRISLVGNYGTISGDLGGLFAPGSEIWSFTPQISVPIFDGGRSRASLEVAEVTKNLEVARYQKTIQTAFREVADALAARATVDEELAARRALTEAAHKSYELSQKRYRRGIDSFLAVLDSQRAWYQAQQDLIDAQLLALTNTVNLYKVLGGGWREHSADSADAGASPAPDPELPFWSRFSSYVPTGRE